MEAIKISHMEAIVYGLEQGRDNGGISREALAFFLRGVVAAEKSVQQPLAAEAEASGSMAQDKLLTEYITGPAEAGR